MRRFLVLATFLAAFAGLAFLGLSTFGFAADWRVASPTLAPNPTYLTFRKGDYRVEAACGRLEGRYRRRLRPAGEITMTRPVGSAACDKALAQLRTALPRATRYRLHDQQLLLTLADGRTLVLVRADDDLPDRPRR